MQSEVVPQIGVSNFHGGAGVIWREMREVHDGDGSLKLIALVGGAACADS